MFVSAKQLTLLKSIFSDKKLDELSRTLVHLRNTTSTFTPFHLGLF